MAVNTTLFLIVIEAAGTAIMKFFGISLPIMQVAVGFAWGILSQDQPETTASNATAPEVDFPSLESMVFYPSRFRSRPAPVASWS